MTPKEAFLQAICENPLDPDIRKVFADWLEENDEPALADFYREWTLAKYHEAEAWLRNYASRITRAEAYEYEDLRPSYAEDEDYVSPVSYEQLLEAAHTQLDGLEGEFPTGTSWDFPDRPIFLNFDIPDFVYETAEEFWKHFSLVTDRYIPKKGYKASLFHCSC